jgi:hypothetical protein
MQLLKWILIGIAKPFLRFEDSLRSSIDDSED